MSSFDEELKKEKPKEELPIYKPVTDEMVDKAINHKQEVVDKDVVHMQPPTIPIKKRFARQKKPRKRMDMQKPLVAIFAISIFFLLLLYNYFPDNEVLFIIILLVGVSCFFPIGAIIGWMFLDKYMLCKLLRKTTHRNMGIVNFVGKGKKIISRIKNFDNDLIWIKNKCWVISTKGIYEIDKNGEMTSDVHPIDPDSIIAMTETVPIMFIDINTMQPLSLHETTKEWIKPEELGSTLKGWVDNQQAKLMFMRRTVDTYFIIVIISCLVSAYFGYQNMNEIESLQAQVEALGQRISSMMLP